jgi:microcystin-dependent protein
MATVDGKTSIKIDELVNGSIISGAVVNGSLILTTRGGANINAGVVTAPTVTALDFMPVGFVYTSVVSTSPQTMFGGTWSRIGQGRVLVGQDGTQTEFSTPEGTGGEKTHTLIGAEMPAHTHAVDHNHTAATTAAAGQHTHTLTRKAGAGTATGVTRGNSTAEADGTTQAEPDHLHNVNIPAYTGTSGTRGGDGAHNNLQPYLVVYMWKRTA